MRASDRSVQFAGGTLGAQRHICAFFNSIDEEHRVLRSFIRDGLDRGLKGFHVIDPDLRNARLVIAAANTALTAALRDDRRFVVRHEDPVAVVFVRAE